jgi:catechol 2,3-dioxygenase-like lactoylglutathione lyase family enzyme
MRLNQVTILVTSVPNSIEFYEKLGLQLIVHTHNNYARFLTDSGGTFSLMTSDKNKEIYGAHIYFECSKLDEKVEELKAKGISFDSEPEDKPWLWREAHLLDPDGHHIVLFRAGEHRINPPWKIQATK